MKSYKCLVCGMNVSQASLHINRNSFLEDASPQSLRCPFCGVSSKYLCGDNRPSFLDEAEKLDSATVDILDKASKLEVFNGEFYMEASRLAKSKEISEMFKDLSCIEMMHAKIHMKLGGFEALPKLTMPTYYEKLTSDCLLVREAHSREKHAVSFYSKNMDKISSQRIRMVFTALSQVESEHIALTEGSFFDPQF